MKYNEYKNLDYAKVGEDILKYWKENRIFEQSVETREGQPTFVFYEGPPSANGTPGIHHVMARAVKDIFCRYKTLQGFQVNRKGGWDTHGLPVELQVEKELGITKEDIGKKITVEEYNARCRETVMRFKSQWDDLTEKMGYWVDLNDPYITFENDYIESVWALLKKLYDKGYLYKGYTIQPFSPAAGTGLSSHELNQPGTYKDVKDTTIVAQFKAKRNEKSEKLFTAANGDDAYFLAWTTTPWTLPSNSALAVGKGIKYYSVLTFNPYTLKKQVVILAANRFSAYFHLEKLHQDSGVGVGSHQWVHGIGETTTEDLAVGNTPRSVLLPDYISEDQKDKIISKSKLSVWEIIGEYTGADLNGIEYEQLMPYVQPDTPAFRVIIGDFVTTEDGTGIVHIAPTFGADDFRTAAQQNIPAITVVDDMGKAVPLVDRQGRFVPEVTDFAGKYVKNYDGQDESHADYKTVDVQIAIKLKEENKAFKVEKYEHTYPHCWRTDKPILYYPLDSWFIKTTAVKQRLIELNETINWKPESTGSGRFGNWLENLVDWNLSRSRYWGTPLPIWRTEDGTEEICIGSIEQLAEEIDRAVDAGLMDAPLPESYDLHRPFVDNIILKSNHGKPMYRETDLIDVWFDSGAMPYAQWHYPIENKDQFKKNFPADFIAEGVDQTRGWFFTLHALAVMLEDSVAFKNVIANGLVLDKNGNKMSKRLGNAVDPFETIGKFGPDATRWYMIVNAPPWDNLKFNTDGVTEVQRRFFGTLQNTYSFFALYANLDNFTFAEAEVPVERRTESDRWIISKLNSLVNVVENYFNDYDPTKAARAIQDFVTDDLSNWYVRLNRKRFWKGEYNEDKMAAYQTLYTCLETVAKLASPIAPFYMDQLFLDLNKVSGKSSSQSVHLERYPKAVENLIDADLEERMALAQTISSLVHSLRKKHTIKVRQPLSRIMMPVLTDKMREQIAAVADLIQTEVNVKNIEFMDDSSAVLVKKIKPNFKRLGQVFGPKLKVVAAAIQGMSQEDIAKLEKENGFAFDMGEEQPVVISPEDVEISSEDIPGWLVASEGKITVALDTTISEELKQEGIARDLVNRIQNLRKDAGLEVQDKINLQLESENTDVIASVDYFRNYICEETQAVTFEVKNGIENATEIDLDGMLLKLGLTVAK